MILQIDLHRPSMESGIVNQLDTTLVVAAQRHLDLIVVLDPTRHYCHWLIPCHQCIVQYENIPIP